MHALIALFLAATALAVHGQQQQQQQVLDLLSVQQEALQLPLSAVGQLTNGCTGFLIGPCHVMTVAHCVYEPWQDIWWQGLDFHPGRNLDDPKIGSSPFGSAGKADVRLHPNWTSTAAASASDAAIIITSTPIGRKVGWFRHKAPADISGQIQPPQQQQQARGLKQQSSKVESLQQQQQQQQQTAEGLSAAVSAHQLTLHIAGYPDNKMNGSMWQQCCTALDWQLQGNLLWHDCYARGGNSGSPIWVVWPSKQQQQQQQGNTSDTPSTAWDRFQAVGVHSSSLRFLKDSQVGVYAEELYAQTIARAQQRQAAAAAGQQSPVCSADTSSFVSITPAPISASTTSAADVSTGSQNKATVPKASPAVNSRSIAGPVTAAPQPALTQAKAPGPAVLQGGTAVSSTKDEGAAAVSGRRALLAGAGGREGEGDDVLLPVAVPFTGDTYKWIEEVLREFDKCPGE